MGIYNCQDTLQEAVMSLINQSYKDWTLIMCDDGSTDRTYEVASMLRDKYPDQIVLLKNAHNRGLNYTLNKCLKEANCKYIARMDGDDRCSPKRLEQEVAVLESEPDISIVSTDMAYFDETGTWGRICHPDYPTKMDFVSGSPFCHAPCLVRKEAFDAVNGYSESPYLLRVEDYHLWFKMYLKEFKGKNIHEVLYEMRDQSSLFYYTVKPPVWQRKASPQPGLFLVLTGGLLSRIRRRGVRYRAFPSLKLLIEPTFPALFALAGQLHRGSAGVAGLGLLQHLLRQTLKVVGGVGGAGHLFNFRGIGLPFEHLLQLGHELGRIGAAHRLHGGTVVGVLALVVSLLVQGVVIHIGNLSARDSDGQIVLPSVLGLVHLGPVGAVLELGGRAAAGQAGKEQGQAQQQSRRFPKARGFDSIIHVITNPFL